MKNKEIKEMVEYIENVVKILKLCDDAHIKDGQAIEELMKLKVPKLYK